VRGYNKDDKMTPECIGRRQRRITGAERGVGTGKVDQGRLTRKRKQPVRGMTCVFRQYELLQKESEKKEGQEEPCAREREKGGEAVMTK